MQPAQRQISQAESKGFRGDIPKRFERIENMDNGNGVQMKLSLMTGDMVNAVSTLLVTLAVAWYFFRRATSRKRRNLPPAIPGGKPFLGNILQLKSKRPHYLFTNWGEEYGPIYRFKAGMKNIVVCTSPELFKEVTITKYDSISKRNLTTAFDVLSGNKGMVVTADYGPDYRSWKKHYVTHLLGSNPQRANRSIREQEMINMVDGLLKVVPSEGKVVNMRDVLRTVLFDFSMHQVFGSTIDSTIHVPGLGSLTKEQVCEYMIYDFVANATIMDWRNFWPIFNWVPNYSLERKLEGVYRRKNLIVKELINKYKKQVSVNGQPGCYCDTVLDNPTFPTEREILVGVWEPIIEGSDTSMVTCEWIMFELAKKPQIQERLHKEIISAVGNRMVNEEDTPKLPLMDAIFKETLRRHPPLPVLPPRLVEKDLTIGGYDIPKGWEVVVNVWGIGMDKKVWSDPDVWDPDRFLNDPSLDFGLQNLKMVPFGGGKRICAGILQALVIIPLLVSTLVQHFEFTLPAAELSTDKVEDEGLATVTTYKATPLQAVVKPRVTNMLPK